MSRITRKLRPVLRGNFPYVDPMNYIHHSNIPKINFQTSSPLSSQSTYKENLEGIINKMKNLSTNPIFKTNVEGSRSTNTNQQPTLSDQNIETYKRVFIQPYFEDFMYDRNITIDQLYNVTKDISDKNKRYIKNDTKEIIKEILNYYKPYNLKKIYTTLLDYSDKSKLEWSDITIIENILNLLKDCPTDFNNSISINVLHKLEPLNISITYSEIMKESSVFASHYRESNQALEKRLSSNNDLVENNYKKIIPSKKLQIIRIIYHNVQDDIKFLHDIQSLLKVNILYKLKTYLSEQLNKQSFNNSSNTDQININKTFNLINRIETMFKIQQSKKNEIISKQKEKEVLVKWIEGFIRSRRLRNNESNVIQKSLQKLKTSDAQNSELFDTVYDNFYDSNIPNEEKIKSLENFVNNN